MTHPNSLAELAKQLNKKAVRWLVVGGYATIAHGYVRMTSDLDIVLDLDSDNILKAVSALKDMGFKPRVPVAMEEFADAEKRSSWITYREMIVFTVWRDAATGFEQIDLFIKEPFPMDKAWEDRFEYTTADGIIVPCVDRERLIAMKVEAGRPKDLDDIAQLRKL